MRTHLDCVPCLLRQSLEAARIVTEDEATHERVVREVLRTAAELELRQPPPVIGQWIHRRLREVTGVVDPYRAAKQRFNELALAALPELRTSVQRAQDPLLAAAEFAVAANAIDMGVAAAFTEAEVHAALRGPASQVLHRRWSYFLVAVKCARRILYLADNAGEIAVDRLVVEQLGPERVTVAVRGTPVLNDAVMEDAVQVGMTELARVIDNGSDAPGTLLEDCSSEFREQFCSADLIISKGQGNFESLSWARDNVAFWFKVKCPVVAAQASLTVGSHALLPPTGLLEGTGGTGGGATGA